MRPPIVTEPIACQAPGCLEDDPLVLVACRDGLLLCVYHANQAGYCWDCGEGDASFVGNEYDNDDTWGMCHDCRSAYYAEWKRRMR